MTALMLLLALGTPTDAQASRGPVLDHDCPDGSCLVDASIGQVSIKMRNPEGSQVLNKALNDAAFWKEASSTTYDKELYDEIRLLGTDTGYVPMITGQGDEDFPNEVVADIVFKRNTDLPKFMSGAEAIVNLGSGFDKTTGAEYRDTFYVLDFTLFYGFFPQRMYRKFDADRNMWVMWFEKLDRSFVDGGTWLTYQQKMNKTKENIDRRWLFNSYTEVSDVYGMFVVTKGEQRTSRVTFVSKVTFDKGSGFIARAGSQMPSVIKAGLKAGFDGCVAIASDEKKKRAQ
ncbi:MAG: hypothetical protein AAF211_20925 [Myxococcota bacterium]